jgi:pimeloyl-ACP methyl ester carboxylesterase
MNADQGNSARAGTSATFVLVHGSAHGSWCWQRVAERLRAAGHKVWTPTLTGLGERRHLLTPSVDLETHCADVMSVIECEELRDVVLVGHSYAGIIITMVADRMPRPLRRLVYLDAQVPASEESWADRQPEVADERVKAAIAYTTSNHLKTPVMQFTAPLDTARMLGLTDPDDMAWVNRRVDDHPLSTYLQRVALKNAVGNGVPKTYIDCTGATLKIFDQIKAKVRGDSSWDYETVGACHDCMVSEPQAVAQLLMKGL